MRLNEQKHSHEVDNFKNIVGGILLAACTVIIVAFAVADAIFEKETIERVFAGAKEKHGMRYTLYRGLTQVAKWVRLKFAAMNLKKLARWKTKRQSPLSFLLFSARIYLLCFAACLDISQAGRFSTG